MNDQGALEIEKRTTCAFCGVKCGPSDTEACVESGCRRSKGAESRSMCGPIRPV